MITSSFDGQAIGRLLKAYVVISLTLDCIEDSVNFNTDDRARANSLLIQYTLDYPKCYGPGKNVRIIEFQIIGLALLNLHVITCIVIYMI